MFSYVTDLEITSSIMITSHLATKVLFSKGAAGQLAETAVSEIYKTCTQQNTVGTGQTSWKYSTMSN